jgi:hypothetical protein
MPVHVSAALFSSDLAAMSNEPGTASTSNDFLLEIQQDSRRIRSFRASSGRRHYPKSNKFSGDTRAVIATNGGFQHFQESLGTVERIEVDFAIARVEWAIRIQNHGGHAALLPFHAKYPLVIAWD